MASSCSTVGHRPLVDEPEFQDPPLPGFQLGQGLEQFGVAGAVDQRIVDAAGQSGVAGVDRTPGGPSGVRAVMRRHEVAGDGDEPGGSRSALITKTVGGPVGPEIRFGDHVVDLGGGHPDRHVATQERLGVEIEPVEGRVVTVGGTRQQFRMSSDFASLVHHRRCFTIPNRFCWVSD